VGDLGPGSLGDLGDLVLDGLELLMDLLRVLGKI